MDNLLPRLKKEYELLGLTYSQVLQPIRFVNFFEGRAKFPNFKSKRRNKSTKLEVIPDDLGNLRCTHRSV
ncbi:MAG: hypothetical protein AAF378_21720 [Cyanobacteria bacterium P01_A01_bin.84]